MKRRRNDLLWKTDAAGNSGQKEKGESVRARDKKEREKSNRKWRISFHS